MILSGGVFTLALALLAAQGPRARHPASRPTASAATAAKKKRPAPAPALGAAPAEKRVVAPAHGDSASTRRDAATPAATAGEAGEGNQASDIVPAGAPTKSAKTKVYTFGAMDVEGKLKTPQLLYFLNRVKLELEMSAPDHRSFMKELQKTADDPAL
jgi:hypothetical protein